MKKNVWLLVLFLAVVNLINPNSVAASQSDEIAKQLKKVKQEIEAAKQSEKKATTEIKRIQNQKEEYNEQVAAIEQWPLPSSDRITSYAGGRIHPITGKPQNHSGLDIAAPGGSKIIAAASGTIVLAQWYGNFGNTVIIEHKDGFRTLYAHIRPGGIKVNAGDEVEAGDKIAEVGTTGRSTGNHLHFGVYVDNNATDPIPYLEG